MKLVEDFDGDTYRVAYTVSFPEAVYVLHVFMKKSKSGSSTPKKDKDRIRVRLQGAEAHYQRNFPRKTP